MRASRDPKAAPEPYDDDEEDDQGSYEAFDKQYGGDHSWEQLQEDESGRLRPLDATAELRARRQRIMVAARSARIRKGMIRYTLLVVDLSRAASASDMRPSRLSVMIGSCKAFIRAYFDQNPLSYLSILVMRDGVAARLTDLGGTPERQISELSAHLDTEGDASLQNALDLAVEQLSSVPPYGHRQVVMLVAALSSVDPGDVYASIAKCKEAKITVSIVGVAAEVHVLRRATEETGGTYGVALNEAHLLELLLTHAPAPPAPKGQLVADLVRMGFPQRAPEEPANAVFVGEMPELLAGGYTCPRCKARTQELPCKCHVCGLTLISSPHLARSYHHLFPVGLYDELTAEEVEQLVTVVAAAGLGSSRQQQQQQEGERGAAEMDSDGQGGLGTRKEKGDVGTARDQIRLQLQPPWDERSSGLGDGEGAEGITDFKQAAAAAAGAHLPKKNHHHQQQPGVLVCYGCLRVLTGDGEMMDGEGGTGVGPGGGGMVLRCPQCMQVFCFECDVFVHETLHNCPGCECGLAGEEEG